MGRTVWPGRHPAGPQQYVRPRSMRTCQRLRFLTFFYPALLGLMSDVLVGWGWLPLQLRLLPSFGSWKVVGLTPNLCRFLVSVCGRDAHTSVTVNKILDIFYFSHDTHTFVTHRIVTFMTKTPTALEMSCASAHILVKRLTEVKPLDQ